MSQLFVAWFMRWVLKLSLQSYLIVGDFQPLGAKYPSNAGQTCKLWPGGGVFL